MKCEICGKPVGNLAKTIRVSGDNQEVSLEIYACIRCRAEVLNQFRESIKYPKHKTRMGSIIRKLTQSSDK